MGSQGHLRRRHGYREIAHGAYGIGVEYAFTMVHGAPPSKFPEYEIPSLVGAH